MADFICKLGTEGGEIIEKRYTASNEKALQLELEQKGFYIFKIRQAGFSFFSRSGGKKIKADDFIMFNQELKSLLQAGMPATKSLSILINRQKESELGKMLKEVRDAIETGSTFSEAFANHKSRLPTAYVSSLVAGERSGELASAIERFVNYAKLTNSLRKNFKKALYYPAFLILISSGMIGLMLMYVLPEFSKFYEGFEQQLPAFTVFVLAVADVLKTQWMLILAAIFAVFFFMRWWKQTELGGMSIAAFTLKLPLIGPLSHKYQLSQIFHSLAVMLRGGMPVMSCLEDLTEAISNPLLRKGLDQARQKVSEGEPLTKAISGTAIDTDISTEMIEVGESTGALPEMLANVAAFYDEEVKNQTEALLSLVEPALLLIMATIVGALLFAMYYPLFNLMGSIGAGY